MPDAHWDPPGKGASASSVTRRTAAVAGIRAGCPSAGLPGWRQNTDRHWAWFRGIVLVPLLPAGEAGPAAAGWWHSRWHRVPRR